MRRRLALPAAVTMALVGLVGCSDDSPKTSSSTPSAASSSDSPSDGPSEEPSPSTSAPVSPTPTKSTEPTVAPPTQERELPESLTMARNLHIAVLDTSVARTPEEKAVVRAWMDFWQGAADTYYLYKPTEQFNRVARGEARRSVLKYTAELKADKQRVVGWAKDNVTSIKIDGDRAVVRDCTKNFTFSVDAEAEPATRPTPYYDVTGKLRKTDGRWTVVAQKSKDLDASCL